MMPRAMKDAILQVYFLLRLPFLYLLKLLFRAPSGEPESVSRILVIRLDRLGDLVLSLPVIDSLRAAYPSATIDIMVKPYLAELAGMIPAVNGVIIYKGKLNAFLQLPGRKYDAVIDMLCDYKIEPAFAALLSKAPVRVGFRGGFREILFTHAIDDWKGSSKSMVEINLELLKPFGIVPQVKIPRLAHAGRGSSDKPIIVIHPGGYYDSQKWDSGRFTSLAKMISESYDVKVIVIDEKALPSLKGFVELLSGCSLLVCNNSGPLHLAAALGVPTVSLMGPTDPVLWWPKGDNQVVIRKGVKCSPCSRGECKDHLCMDLIIVDEVFGEVRKLMEKVYGLKG